MRILAIVFLSTALISTATAQGLQFFNVRVLCAQRQAILDRIHDHYGEKLIAEGVTAGGWLFELFRNMTNGTFTTIQTDPENNEVSCIISTGKDLEAVPVEVSDTAL